MLNSLKYLLIPLFVLIMVFFITYSDFHFQTSELEKLTPEKAKSVTHLSFDQYYELDQTMAYKVEVKNRENDSKATLLWPEEPFSTFLVLVPYYSKDLDKQTIFHGRLVSCVYKCLPGDMLVVNDDFSQLILKNFPQYKDKYSKLPRYILDTTDEPKGFWYYINHHRVHYGILGLSFLFSLVLMARQIWKTIR